MEVNHKLDVAIVFAGGKGTRLSEYTFGSILPKILVSVGNSTVFDKIVDTWKDVTDRLIFVVSSESWKAQLEQYMEIRGITSSFVEIVVYERQIGTFDTVVNVFKQCKIQQSLKHIGIFWSDIWVDKQDAQQFVNEHINTIKQFPETTLTIYSDKNKSHRFCLVNDKSIEQSFKENGDVCGLYIFDYKALERLCYVYEIYELEDLSEQKPDLVEVISMNLNHYNSYVGDVFDIGDKVKLRKYMSNADLSVRFFNSIEFVDDTVIKTNADTKGFKVAKNEIAWYDFVKKYCYDINEMPIPKIISTKIVESKLSTKIVMEDLRSAGYITLHEYVTKYDFNNAQYAALINLVDNKLALLRQIDISSIDMKEIEFSIRQAYEEYFVVTKNRIESITEILRPTMHDVFVIPEDNSVSSVFGHPVTQYSIALDIIHKEFVRTNVKNKLCFGHGDANSSNVMIKAKNREFALADIKFIDPRGKFGNAQYLTDEIYDKAKLIYGLTGYSDFNLEKDFTANIDYRNNLTYKCGNNVSPLDKLIELSEYYTDYKVLLMVGVIWLKLPAYIINNPAKSIAAFHTGLSIINYFNKKLNNV